MLFAFGRPSLSVQAQLESSGLPAVLRRSARRGPSENLTVFSPENWGSELRTGLLKMTSNQLVTDDRIVSLKEKVTSC
jgi:hypothetical protein